ATNKLAKLTFTQLCDCKRKGCVDCRSWVTEADVPLDPQGPVLFVMAHTIGVDGIRFYSQKYTVVVLIGSAFDHGVVQQSIRENVASLGPIDCFTGMSVKPTVRWPMVIESEVPENPALHLQADEKMATQMEICAVALGKAAKALEVQPEPILKLGNHSIVFERKRYLQLWPPPSDRSWIRAVLLRLFSD